MCVQQVGVCGCPLGGCTGKSVAKPLLVFWGQECLPFGLNGVQVQGTSGLPKAAWNSSSPDSLAHLTEMVSFI